MLKALIADDEKILCEGMKVFIPWSDYGYDIPDTADNGCGALEMLDKKDYQLVITDIRMPGIDGLELARIILERGMDCCVVIMSGCRDFEYAQNAMEFGVSRYLLKPIDEKKLTEVLLNVKEKYEINTQKRLDEQQTMDLVKRSLLQNLSNSRSDDLKKIITEKNFIRQNCPYIIYLLKAAQADRSKLAEIVSRLRPAERLTVFDFNAASLGLLYMICDHCDDTEIFSKELRNAAALCESGENALVIAGSPIFGVQDFFRALELAAKVLELSFYYPNSKVLYCKDFTEVPAPSYENFAWDPETICNNIMLENTGAVIAEIDEMIRSFIVNRISVNLCLSIATSLLLKILHLIPSTGGYLSDCFGHEMDVARYYTISDIKTLENRLKSACLAVIDYIGGKKNKKGLHDMKNITDYIDQNYDAPITVKSLSNQFYMNPSYLGRKFKEHIGMGILDYLNLCRVERAKTLLMDRSVKSSTIFSMVGYCDMDNYYAQFKKITGMNPTQYRSLYLTEN